MKKTPKAPSINIEDQQQLPPSQQWLEGQIPENDPVRISDTVFEKVYADYHLGKILWLKF